MSDDFILNDKVITVIKSVILKSLLVQNKSINQIQGNKM